MVVFLSITTVCQAKNTTLSCAGKLSLFPDQLLDVEVNSIVLYVSEKSVTIANLKGIFADEGGSTYPIAQSTDSQILFTHPINSRIGGTLNRYSGQLFLGEKDSTQDNLLIRVFRGVCKRREKLF